MHQIEMIPLSKLVSSKANVRRGSAIAIEQLATSIDQVGLKQNLVVAPERDKKQKETGRFAVAGGNRRLLAMQLLVQRRVKGWTASRTVPCLVVAADAALESSLTENFQREAMHPADEYLAFRAMIESEGATVERVAERFGVSALKVRQRLKLAEVAPSLLAIYREGGMTLEQLTAFTVTSDVIAQERAWSSVSDYARNAGGQGAAAEIRRLLTQGEVDALRDPRARFIGIAAYEAAGGVVNRDLFGGENAGYLADASLLDRLVDERLATVAEQVKAEGWSWIENLGVRGTVPLWHYGRSKGKQREATKAERSELKKLAAKRDEISQRLEAAEEDESVDYAVAEALSEELEAITRKLAQIDADRMEWSDRAKKKAGAVVYVDGEGLCIERGLIRNEPSKASAATSPASPPLSPAIDATATKRDPSAPSEALTRRLTAQRTIALQAVLCDQPHVALVCTVHALALDVFYAHGSHGYAVEIHGTHEASNLESADDTIGASRAYRVVQDQHQAWQAVLPETSGKFFGWLLAQSSDELLRLLAYVVARHVNTVQQRSFAGRETASASAIGDLSRAVGLDMASWWSPTTTGYLSHVSKTCILSALREAGLDDDAKRLSAAKKNELAIAAEALLADRRWLPNLLQTPATSLVDEKSLLSSGRISVAGDESHDDDGLVDDNDEA